jgi:hypothetical protein
MNKKILFFFNLSFFSTHCNYAVFMPQQNNHPQVSNKVVDNYNQDIEKNSISVFLILLIISTCGLFWFLLNNNTKNKNAPRNSIPKDFLQNTNNSNYTQSENFKFDTRNQRLQLIVQDENKEETRNAMNRYIDSINSNGQRLYPLFCFIEKVNNPIIENTLKYFKDLIIKYSHITGEINIHFNEISSSANLDELMWALKEYFYNKIIYNNNIKINLFLSKNVPEYMKRVLEQFMKDYIHYQNRFCLITDF